VKSKVGSSGQCGNASLSLPTGNHRWVRGSLQESSSFLLGDSKSISEQGAKGKSIAEGAF